MTKLVPTISANLYLLKRSVKKANQWGLKHLLSIVIGSLIFLQCVFFQHYLNELLNVISQKNQASSLNELQNLQSNQALLMPLSLGKDISFLLGLLVAVYFLFDYRNKFSLLKIMEKEDNLTKLYLGAKGNYIIRELLLKNFWIYLEGFVLSFFISFFLNRNFLSQLNELLPYQLSPHSKQVVLGTTASSLLTLLGLLSLFSMLLELIHTQKIKKSGAF